jgi:hypothetical protein
VSGCLPVLFACWILAAAPFSGSQTKRQSLNRNSCNVLSTCLFLLSSVKAASPTNDRFGLISSNCRAKELAQPCGGCARSYMSSRTF